MLYSDINSFARGLLAEPFADRYTDTQLYQWITQAQREIARETRALEGRKGLKLTGLPEYPLPALVSIKRVYVAGPGYAQRITHTSIPQMEGDQLRIYDNSGGVVQGPLGLSSGPTTQTPQWLALPPAPYPVQAALAGFGYNPIPMFPGQRPQYYLRGIGRIGLTPIPIYAANTWIVLDIYETTENVTVAQAGQPSPFPDDWIEAIAWYTLKFAYHSDQETGQGSLEADALGNYNECLKKLLSFVSNINEDDPQGPYMLTHRAIYIANANDGSGYGGGWDG